MEREMEVEDVNLLFVVRLSRLLVLVPLICGCDWIWVICWIWVINKSGIGDLLDLGPCGCRKVVHKMNVEGDLT